MAISTLAQNANQYTQLNIIVDCLKKTSAQGNAQPFTLSAHEVTMPAHLQSSD
jgi:hypothetical protein